MLNCGKWVMAVDIPKLNEMVMRRGSRRDAGDEDA
jgi:hypothetical protein|nr:MAG TPA: hypothetical protein [Caudoviricetes sp.]